MVNTKPQLESLLSKTDYAFEQLKNDPLSGELSEAYEHAKSELDCYLADLKSSLKKRYKDF